EIPQLRRVIVSDGSEVTMAVDLETAIRLLFGETIREIEEEISPSIILQEGTTLNSLIENANKYYNDATDAAQQGDWAEYGRSLEDLKNTLESLQNFIQEDILEEQESIEEE
ncbi:MAG: hypothetical protein PHF16_07545, partial [Atribacterota bacterium]|nr:hypothetical protein [Atribacterota bacterium]